MRAFAFGLVFVAATAGDATAQGWAPAKAEFARYGLQSIVCRGAGHTYMCLALACRDGRLDLVNVAGGGGPMFGETVMQFGGRRFALTFEDDPRAVDVLGVAASRARVEPGVLGQIAGAGDIELRPASTRSRDIVQRFPGRGLGAELRRAGRSCR